MRLFVTRATLLASIGLGTLVAAVDWFPVQVGLMMHDPTSSSRSHPHSKLVRWSRLQQRRDYAQSVASFSRRGESTELQFHHLQVRRPSRKNATQANLDGDTPLNGFQGIITWYTGVDLLDRKGKEREREKKLG